jgi:hypothetical protein
VRRTARRERTRMLQQLAPRSRERRLTRARHRRDLLPFLTRGPCASRVGVMRLATYGLLSSRTDRRFGRDRDQRSTCCYVLGVKSEAGFESGYFHCVRGHTGMVGRHMDPAKIGRGSKGVYGDHPSIWTHAAVQSHTPVGPRQGRPVALLGQRLGLAPNAARITSAVFSAASGARGCPHTTARMKSGPTSRS